jgi:hypothetical protein
MDDLRAKVMMVAALTGALRRMAVELPGTGPVEEIQVLAIEAERTAQEALAVVDRVPL